MHYASFTICRATADISNFYDSENAPKTLEICVILAAFFFDSRNGGEI